MDNSNNFVFDQLTKKIKRKTIASQIKHHNGFQESFTPHKNNMQQYLVDMQNKT